MVLRVLIKYFDKRRVNYVSIKHPDAVTDRHIEGVSYISGSGYAKAVLARVDGKCAMVILPSAETLDLVLLQELLGTRDIEFVNEEDFENMFHQSETDTLPLPGSSFVPRVYIDQNLTGNSNIMFSSGNFNEVIAMPYKEFERVMQPMVISFQKPGWA